jgi:hypothetical protein
VGGTSTGGQPSTSHKEKRIDEGEEDAYISYYSLDIDCKGWGIKIKISN